MLKRLQKLRKIIYFLFSNYFNLISLFSKRAMSASGHGGRRRRSSERFCPRSSRWGEREKRENKDVKFFGWARIVNKMFKGC